LYPLRDRTERWVNELAAPWQGDFLASGIDLDKLRAGPSVYLRLRQANTKSVKAIRKAAQTSLRDGFTSCLFVSQSKAADPTVGPACRTAGDCEPGKLCNEWNVCADPEQPYNLRLAYRTLRVLSSDWTDEVHEATSELGLAAYERDLDNVAKRDVPVTIEVLQRSKYFTLVLDEEPPGGLPKPGPEATETSEETLQGMPHFARIGIWDLTTSEPLFRMRAEAAGEFVAVGKQAVADPANVAAQRRQVNNCSLALGVRSKIEEAAAMPAEAQGGGGVAPSAKQ
jgi:hypothetical protein